VVVIPALSDGVITIPIGCLWVSTTVVFDTIGEILLIGRWQCSIQWLPIGMLCGAKCGCEYTSGSLLLVWMDGRIYRLYGPNWLPNSMPFNLFWTIGSNMTISKSTNSWFHVLAVYLVWSNFRFPWCEYDYGTSSNTFTCAFAYSDDHRQLSLISTTTSILVFSSTS